MYRFGRKKLIMYCIVFLLLLTTSCASTLEKRVKAFHEAANSGDVEKLMAFYADDVRFDTVGTPMAIESKEKLRKVVEEQFILNCHMTFTDVKVKGNTSFCNL